MWCEHARAQRAKGEGRTTHRRVRRRLHAEATFTRHGQQPRQHGGRRAAVG